MEEKLLRNNLYKLFLISLKYIPVLLTLVYVSNSILCCFNIDTPILSIVGGISILPWIFMYIATYVFKFCTYHRLLLYYILIDDGINLYDFYYPIPVEDSTMIAAHAALIGILVLALLINHVKHNKRKAITNSGGYRCG